MDGWSRERVREGGEKREIKWRQGTIKGESNFEKSN